MWMSLLKLYSVYVAIGPPSSMMKQNVYSNLNGLYQACIERLYNHLLQVIVISQLHFFATTSVIIRAVKNSVLISVMNIFLFNVLKIFNPINTASVFFPFLAYFG